MNNPNEITASNSQAVLISQLTDSRRHLRVLIAKIKRIAPAIPAREREELLSVAMEAERAL